MPIDMPIVTNDFCPLQPVGCIVRGKDRVAIEDQRYAGCRFDFCYAHIRSAAFLLRSSGYDTEFDTKTMPLFLFINVHFDGLALLLLSKT